MARNRSRSETHPGGALRAARTEQGLSLRALAARSGLPYSTLSKLENGKMALTYDKLTQLAQALNVDIGTLIADPRPAEPPAAVGRRSVSRAGEALAAASEQRKHHYIAADLLGKRMVPILIEVTAESVEAMGGLVRHDGEEYLYVLSGTMELHSDLYAPLRLEAGDSVYFDSAMAHAYVRVGDQPCTVLSVCAGQSVQRLAEYASADRGALGQPADDH